MKKIFIVIPAYNEEKVIKNVVSNIIKTGYQNIIVVNDGSTDNTGIFAKEAGATVISHLINRGKGAAIKTGIEAAKILQADTIVTFDGDGQHEANDIKNLISFIDKDYDVVLGSRDFGSKEIPIYKKIANYLANIFTWLIYGIWLTDTQSGFRAFSKKAIALIDTQSDRYEYETEMIREMVKHKLKYKQIPIKVYYTTYSQQKNQKQNLLNGLTTLIKLIITD